MAPPTSREVVNSALRMRRLARRYARQQQTTSTQADANHTRHIIIILRQALTFLSTIPYLSPVFPTLQNCPVCSYRPPTNEELLIVPQPLPLPVFSGLVARACPQCSAIPIEATLFRGQQFPPPATALSAEGQAALAAEEDCPASAANMPGRPGSPLNFITVWDHSYSVPPSTPQPPPSSSSPTTSTVTVSDAPGRPGPMFPSPPSLSSSLFDLPPLQPENNHLDVDIDDMINNPDFELFIPPMDDPFWGNILDLDQYLND